MDGCNTFTSDNTLPNDQMEVQIYYNNGWRITFYPRENSGCGSIEGIILLDSNNQQLVFYTPNSRVYIDGIFAVNTTE